jgi:DNA-directed RNA polymerase specialized sigma24 family protein
MQERLYADIELLDRLRSDDTACFEELYHRHWRMVYFYALKKLHSRLDARRVVVLVFADIWKERYQIPVEASLPILLYQKVRVAVVHQLHRRLNDISGTQWIEGYVLPYFGGEAPALPNDGKVYEQLEAQEEAWSMMMNRDTDKTHWKQWVMQFVKGPVDWWNKPWVLVGRNH